MFLGTAKTRPLLKEREFHKGLKKEWTKRLSEKELGDVAAALTGVHNWKGGALCYEPHHGFVFYDKNDVVLGHVEICFMCGNYYSYPKKGLSAYWNLGVLSAIVSAHKLPMFSIRKEWEDFFSKS